MSARTATSCGVLEGLSDRSGEVRHHIVDRKKNSSPVGMETHFCVTSFVFLRLSMTSFYLYNCSCRQGLTFSPSSY